jgi:hypothetical protein
MIVEVPLPEHLTGLSKHPFFWLDNGSRRIKVKVLDVSEDMATLRLGNRIGVGSYQLFAQEKGGKPETEEVETTGDPADLNSYVP